MKPGSVPRAPQTDGAVVAVPPLSDVGNVILANRRLFGRSHVGPLGRDWTELRRLARQAAVTAASGYLQQNDEPIPAINPDSLLVAGHQPELYHPGVWIKNFALNGLARNHEATPLHIVVDNDAVKSTALRVPASPSGDEPFTHLTSVAFDHPAAGAPWEEQRIGDAALFASFAERVAELLRGWHFRPLLSEFWPDVLQQAERTPLVGECFAAARRHWERRWGCHNLEVRLSDLCGGEPFAWFAAHLLSELPRFHAVYNESLQTYRRTHRLRSRNHPVPDLAVDGAWLETPFWGWRTGETRRRRLFARPRSGALELRCGSEPWPELSGPVNRWPETWQGLQEQGLKARTRALTTTMFSRLFLADLFIHGIGGGKYDELTDAIIQRFYGITPPGFLVLSGTRLLPLPSFHYTVDDRRRLAHGLRDLYWNPQRHHAASPYPKDLLEQKAEWIKRQPSDSVGRRERFLRLRELTEQLRTSLGASDEHLREPLAVLDRKLASNAVLRRRDYSFCLYPEEVLRPFCTQFLAI